MVVIKNLKFNIMGKVRFGIIGTSLIVDKVLKGAFLDDRFEFTALYSRTREKGEAFAAKYGVKHVFTSLEEMASSDLIDAVYIASPNSLHAPQSILCMKHKKHVLCEKPFASNLAEVKEMIAVAKENGVALMEAMIPTMLPNFQSVRDNLPRIGKISKYFSSYCQYSSRFDEYKEGFYANAFLPEFAGGSIMDIGVYTVYPMVVLFGRPERVCAEGTFLESGVDGEGVAIFKYPHMTGTVLFSKFTHSTLPTEIQGEEGSIQTDKIGKIDRVKMVFRNREDEDLTVPNSLESQYYEVKEFIDIVQSGRQHSDINSWENSLIVMEILDEIRRQIKERGTDRAI